MATKKQIGNFEEGMRLLTNAAAERWPLDLTRPGIITSCISGGGAGYYMSVVRYHAKYAEQKEVVVNAKGETLLETLNELAKRFLEKGQAEDKLRGIFR